MKYFLVLVFALSFTVGAEEAPTDQELAEKEMREKGLSESRPYVLGKARAAPAEVVVEEKAIASSPKVVAVASGIDYSDRDAALKEMRNSGASVSRPYIIAPPGVNRSSGSTGMR